MNTKDIQAFWEQTFSELGITPEQINSIICTHQHPDHFGFAGYAQAMTKAPVYISEAAYQYANLLWGKQERFAEHLRPMFLRHGVPEELVADVVENLNWFKTQVYPFPDVTALLPQSEIIIHNQAWSVIETSGHAKGHMMLYNKASGFILCGDQVLPHITPHVGVVPSEEQELPLLQFIDCLTELKALQVSEGFPGHGERFTNWRARIEEIIAHHMRRLSKLEHYIQEHGELTAFTASNVIFGTHLHKQPQHLRFAITEIIAHLDYLAAQGKVILEHRPSSQTSKYVANK